MLVGPDFREIEAELEVLAFIRVDCPEFGLGPEAVVGWQRACRDLDEYLHFLRYRGNVVDHNSTYIDLSLVESVILYDLINRLTIRCHARFIIWVQVMHVNSNLWLVCLRLLY